MYISIEIENFTVFKKARFDFVPGINVLMGANASGKTHLLKLLYAMQPKQTSESKQKMAEALIDVFTSNTLIDLIRHRHINKEARVLVHRDDGELKLRIQQTNSFAVESEFTPVKDDETEINSNGVFIPVKDMLGHSVGFLSLYDQRSIDFDITYRNILSLASLPPLRENALNGKQPLLDLLTEKLEGRVVAQGDRFYLTGNNGTFEMHMVSEGWRKLALLYLLIANGSLDKGSVLYWDEPETNLNPSVMDELVQILLELSRLGVQIFLATHNYFILKELDLQRTAEDSLRMFALERNKDGSVKVHPAETYLELKPNLIATQFDRIYDMQVERALRD